MCIVLAVLTIVNYFVPDPLPFVDELIMTLVSMGVCARKMKE
jgi:hypothetical protein